MRKASEASFSALIWPVSTTVSPTPPLVAVMVRTGRASTVLAFFCSQPASNSAIAGNSRRLRAALRLAFGEMEHRATARSSPWICSIEIQPGERNDTYSRCTLASNCPRWNGNR